MKLIGDIAAVLFMLPVIVCTMAFGLIAMVSMAAEHPKMTIALLSFFVGFSYFVIRLF